MPVCLNLAAFHSAGYAASASVTAAAAVGSGEPVTV